MNKQIVDALLANDNFVLATHIRPDGDALGSMLGLGGILAGMGKNVACCLEAPVSELYSFLPQPVRVETDIAGMQDFIASCGDNLIGLCLDCGDIGRLGKLGPELSRIHPFIVIDHHHGNDGFGDICWIEPHRSSTGEMVFDLAGELGETISPEVADCLYTAIVTDTGSFQYDCTTNHTFKVAATLVECGVEPGLISQNIYDNNSFARLQLMQMVLANLESYFDDQVAIIRVTREMLIATGTGLDDSEGFINLPRSVRSVRVAAFLKESSTDDQMVSVSLRSKDDFDVAAVAAKFGGGGHRKASGFRMPGLSLAQVLDKLLPVLEQRLSQE